MPEFRIHESGKVTRIGGSDHDPIFCIPVQGSGLGGEDDISVKRFVGGGGLTLFTDVSSITCGEPHGLCGDG